ncbi:(2Fe-2S)-binding protein, partial [Mycobacterium alsense]|uniref:(2Fe-2S)-binding protein n=1 Tax=Mycobacterium alsense TaxID=324058 RepID=UPI000ADB7E13
MHERPIRLSVNGTPITATVEPRMTLADFLREKCGLTGTHLGCEHGSCGACTVLVDGDAIPSTVVTSRPSAWTANIRHDRT